MPRMLPVSSNDTSTVGGSTESTRLTMRFPFDSPSFSPSMVFLLFGPALLSGSPGEPFYPTLDSPGLYFRPHPSPTPLNRNSHEASRYSHRCVLNQLVGSP